MITIQYSSLPGLKNSILQPIVPVKFINKTRETLTFALVDSGAAGAVISTVIAEDLGINWNKIPATAGFSVGGNFRSHSAKVKIELFGEEFSIYVNIIEGIAPYKAILGQRDIFQRAKIIFEAYKKQFQIEFRNFN